MAKLEFTIEIAAPVERVAAFFVPQRMPYWYGSDMQAGLEVQGGAADFQVGQKVRITGRIARREVSLTAVITRLEWPSVLEWQFRDPYGIRGLQSWTLESTGAGTHVTMRDAYELPGRGRLAGFLDALLMKRGVTRRDRSWLARLKQIGEAK